MNRHAVVSALQHVSPAYPPSFDNNAWLFAWALFGRLLVLMLSLATIVRITSLSRAQQMDARDPVLQARVGFAFVLGTTTLSSLSDVVNWLTWNEVGPVAMNAVLVASRVLDGATMIPLTSALIVPTLMTFWAARQSVLQGSVHRVVMGDNRAIWSSLDQPLRLTALCAAAAALVTAVKWAAWNAHH